MKSFASIEIYEEEEISENMRRHYDFIEVTSWWDRLCGKKRFLKSAERWG